MRLFICLIVLISLSYQSFSQEPSIRKKPGTREEFLSRSKSQRTAAWILLGAGVVGIAAVSPGNTNFGTLGTVVVLSSAAILGSIPLFIAARKNKKRGLAKPISFYLENMPSDFNKISLNHQTPVFSVKVALSL